MQTVKKGQSQKKGRLPRNGRREGLATFSMGGYPARDGRPTYAEEGKETGKREIRMSQQEQSNWGEWEC